MCARSQPRRQHHNTALQTDERRVPVTAFCKLIHASLAAERQSVSALNSQGEADLSQETGATQKRLKGQTGQTPNSELHSVSVPLINYSPSNLFCTRVKLFSYNSKPLSPLEIAMQILVS